jgi:hypothetical protein
MLQIFQNDSGRFGDAEASLTLIAEEVLPVTLLW